MTLTNVIDKLNKKHDVTQISVIFSGAVNSAEAGEATGIYKLTTPGKKGSYTAKNAGTIKIKSATYNQANDTVVLIPKKVFALTKPVQLLITGTAPSGLQDAEGRLIDGNHDGIAGGNAIAILKRAGATLSAVELARTNYGPRVQAHLVDALLARDELFAGVKDG